MPTASAGGKELTGSVKTDHANLALATRDAALDLTQLRAGDLIAQSFTHLFIDIKGQEAISQPLPGC